MAACMIPAFAVTDKEMEEAKAITAQAYLRYANDGSGYLDEFKVTSMAQLESKLKAKEKENLKAFNTVKIPSDYASWDKARLIEFWGVTFFTSPNLAEKGKAARSRVKKRISAMSIAAPVESKPTADPVPAPAAEESNSSADATNAASTEIQATSDPAPSKAEEILEKQEEILADQNAIAQDTEERQYKKEDSGTWIYVLVLVVLIGVVIWLVVFAANMMKKQSEPLEALSAAKPDAKDTSDEELRRQYDSTRSALNEYKAAFEDTKAENARLLAEIKTLKAEVSRLKELARNTAVPAPSAKPSAPAPASKPTASTIYLGRVNNRGLFVRADRSYSPGHSFYRLETRDGLVGTFILVNSPEVYDIALGNPVEYLSGGCAAIDIENTAGMHTIITENAGTAMFENGTWKVLRKSRIRYE